MLRSAIGAFIGRAAAVLLFAVLGALGIGPEKLGQLMLGAYFDNAPLFWRGAFLGLAGVVFWLLIWPAIREWLKPPLEILFDPRHPLGRYGTTDIWTDDRGLPYVGSANRIGVKNNTDRTIKNVQVTLEGTFAEILKPTTLRFTRTQRFSHNLDPRREELVDVFMYTHDEIGREENLKKYGREHSLKIVASGTDVPPAEIVLRFNASEPIMMTFPRDDRWQDWVGCG